MADAWRVNDPESRYKGRNGGGQVPDKGHHWGGLGWTVAEHITITTFSFTLCFSANASPDTTSGVPFAKRDSRSLFGRTINPVGIN